MIEQKQIAERTTYKFERVTTYSDGETYTDVKIWTNDALENDYWPDIANKFLLWLSSIYSYDIRGSVKLPDDEADEMSKDRLIRILSRVAENAVSNDKGVSYDEI